MVMVRIKGHEFDAILIRDSFDRRAQRFKNNIINSLRSIGLSEDDVEIELEPNARRNLPAVATWYLKGSRLHYSYKSSSKYVENLYVISKLIELEVKAIKDGTKSLADFISDFSEEEDVEKDRQEARELLGVEKDSLDLDLINQKFKALAKDLHPDMPNGDIHKFKAVNRAHKILKRELG